VPSRSAQVTTKPQLPDHDCARTKLAADGAPKLKSNGCLATLSPKVALDGKSSRSPSTGERERMEEPMNISEKFCGLKLKSDIDTDGEGERRVSGSEVDEDRGVASVLDADDELLDDTRVRDEESEPKDDVRE